MRLIDLAYVATRLRGTATGGAEVDLIFESARLVFSRWQVQCKNTPRVALDDVAKEVGLTHFLKSNAIVMVATGEIGREARRFANKIMADSNLCVVMVDGNDLALIETRPAAIVDVFTREAHHAMDLKGSRCRLAQTRLATGRGRTCGGFAPGCRGIRLRRNSSGLRTNGAVV